jgi:hypothetical protein
MYSLENGLYFSSDGDAESIPNDTDEAADFISGVGIIENGRWKYFAINPKEYNGGTSTQLQGNLYKIAVPEGKEFEVYCDMLEKGFLEVDYDAKHGGVKSTRIE